jgi:Gpi18-like mannosyltransferase
MLEKNIPVRIESREKPALRYYLGGTLLLCTSVFVRYISYPVLTSDYLSFVKKWFETLSTNPGLTAFHSVFADYTPLYLYAIKIFTYLPFSSLFSTKMLSALFDVGIALLICALLRYAAEARFPSHKLFFVFAVVVSIPTILLNSSLWAQCDSLYAFFALASLYFIIRDEPLPVVIAFGISFSLKLQSIFFLPIVLGYFIGRRYSLAYLLFIPGIFVLTILPAALGGGPFFTWALRYFSQTSEYVWLTLNAPSVFAFINSGSLSASAVSFAGKAGIALAAIAACAIIVAVSRQERNENLSRSEWIHFLLRYSLLSAILLPFFLPHMHERYFYLADVLATLFALYQPRRAYVAVLVVGASFISYMPYLSSYSPFLGALKAPLWIAALAMLVAAVTLVFPSAPRRRPRSWVISPAA